MILGNISITIQMYGQKISQTLICMYGHIGTLLHKVGDKEGSLHNGICVAKQN